MHSSPSTNGNILKRAVLILNTNYAPLDICDTKRAICMWYLKKAEVIENYQDKLHSPGTTIYAPSVIKLHDFVHYQSLEVILSRKNLLVRDNYTCQYCGRKNSPLTIDHIIPRERGGKNTWENLVMACIQCNLMKGNRTPEEAQMRLRQRPRKPNRIHHFQNYVSKPQVAWRPYLFMEPAEIIEY